MQAPMNRPCDPSPLATAVRGIALEAHRVLKDPTASPRETLDLVDRLGALRDEACGLSSSDLARWLESARRRFEAVKG
jgi:hypothetical protein